MDGREILVYDSWSGDVPRLIGTLNIEWLRGRETYSFSFDDSYLESAHGLFLDPSLEPYRGRQYSPDGGMFGFLSDSAPDRWGRMLMKRRAIIDANRRGEKARELRESDFLLGVCDEARMGGLDCGFLPSGYFLHCGQKEEYYEA